MNLEKLIPDLCGKRLLITGGSGFFGKNLCETLSTLNRQRDLGMTIYALARNPLWQEGVEFIQHDITKPFDFKMDLDFVIHAATPVSNDNKDFNNNIDIIVNGTQNTLLFAEKNQVKNFLLVSSGAVYGEMPQELGCFSESYVPSDSFFNFHSAYMTGKRISELLALNWAKRTNQHLTIARCFAFSGRYLPLNQHFAIGNFIRDALTQKTIEVKGDGSALRTYMDEEDLVLWLLTILIQGKKDQIYNVGSDVEVSIKDLAHKIAEIVPGTIVNIQGQKLLDAKRNRYIPSIEKAQKELGLRINLSLEKSLRKIIEFNRGKIV